MTASIIGFRPRQTHGTIHVFPCDGGFEIAQESASGSSWGSFEGPYPDRPTAVAAAHALNLRQYGGVCAISISSGERV